MMVTYLVYVTVYYLLRRIMCAINENKNKTMKIKNIIWAMEADAAAIPVNPSIPAMIAITKNTNT